MYSSFDVERIAVALGKASKTKDGYKCLCPCHPDKEPSLNIKLSPNNDLVFKCFAGCEWKTIKEKCADIGLIEKFTPKKKDILEKPMAMNAIYYPYHDARGNVLSRKVRKLPLKPKKMWNERNDNGMFKPGLNGAKIPLYNLPAVMAAEVVYLPEGEKDAETLIKAGLVATTNHCGATHWEPEYTETLRGKVVVMMPDNDDPGLERIQILIRALYGVVKELRLFVPPVTGKGEDVTDWVEAGGDPLTIFGLSDVVTPPAQPAPAPKPVAKPSAYAELLASMPECPVKNLAIAINDSLQIEQPGIALAAALAFFATVRSGGTYLNCPEVEVRRIHANEFFCIIARSGASKTTCMELIEGLLVTMGFGDWHMNQPSSDVALMEQLAAGKRLFCWDEFGEAFAQAVAGVTSINASIVRESKIFWGRNTNIKGKGYAKSANRPPVNIKEAYYTWLTATTPNRIQQALSGENVLDGFVPRFMFIEGENEFKWKEQKKFVCPQSVWDALEEIYPRYKSGGDIAQSIPLRNFSNEPIEVVFEPEALEESLKYKAVWQKDLQVYKNDIDDALSNKRLAHYLKLCLIVCPCSIITLDVAKWVAKFVKHSADRQQAFCESEIGRGQISILKEKLLQNIPTDDWIAQGELFKKCVHNVEGKIREPAMKDLEAEGKIFSLRFKTDPSKSGKPPVNITQSEALYEQMAAQIEAERLNSNTSYSS